MGKLLYIQASPRGGRSKSIAVADAFVDAYRRANEDDKIDTLNVFEEDLPAFDGPALAAKYAILGGGTPGDEHREAWSRVEAVIERFKSADKYLFAVPMWNFSIPHRLKQYFDVIVQPTYAFSYDPDSGYTGLITNRPACVVYASGGDYSSDEMQSVDMQKPYMNLILTFIGFEDIRSVTVAPTLMGAPAEKDESIRRACDKARATAADF
ncbi:MAG: FMN-dependent NADH-azoreductase [Phycisphaerae bacterium]